MKTIDQPSDVVVFILQINEVVKIQAFIRANKARDDYKTLSEYRPSSALNSSPVFCVRVTLKTSFLAQSTLTTLRWRL